METLYNQLSKKNQSNGMVVFDLATQKQLQNVIAEDPVMSR